MGERLRGRAIVVTGAGSGIGRVAAEAFAAEGADLVLADVEGVETVAKETGGIGVTADVTDEEQVARMAAAALEAFGRIDGLYANAGIDGAGRAHELSHATWSRVLDVNLTGTWLSIRAVLPAMLAAGGGSIVTQASSAALAGVPDLAAYSAAKGGVTALTRQIAVDYGREGIRANALCPGTVWTPLVERTYAERGGDATFGSMDAMRERAARGYPLGRLGTPAEIAAFALFLLSDESSWISGGVFAADGGYTAR
ncbi:SDR family oxidoreductase [Pseudonocardia sp. RS11V-5]|uniref:SDR family NAD(P)-dependent oxidoreductase n=1 Tax=Pseudonocardia terrae TaxID=2905831 RepID=UPI001E42E8A9|nr:SDR family NAD(P)-dependent oxidoreductase [Pseudonocardia terrae]MCE3550445.1 SDR family oxidoreductase [Pseudonocardia terrae]